MVINEKGGCKGKKVARKHLTKVKNELRLSHSSNEKYAIVKKLLGNTCDVICDDGKERRCMIRGKFTGRNKRDNMIDSGIYVLIGLREWVNECSGGAGHNNVNYCDLLEVYNSSERDILRRTHGVFQSYKDESITGKYDDSGPSSISFVDQNTLKYQDMVKKMEKKGGDGSDGGDSDDDETCGVQKVIITTNVKHIGKGVISQSYDISESDSDSDKEQDEQEDEDEDEDEDEQEDEEEEEEDEKYNKYKNEKINTHNHYKKTEYIQENIVDIDDI
jgi:translation initiation factor IF-1